MTNILHQSLGLNAVAGDPNNLPDGRYDGKVAKESLIYVDSKDTLSHVIQYQVTDGEKKGGTKDEWFTLATQPRLKDGSRPAKGEVDITTIGSLEPSMSDQAKDWYKKRYLDLGFTSEEVDSNSVEIGALVGLPVTFGVKRKDGYVNINFVEKREVDAATSTTESTGPVSLDF